MLLVDGRFELVRCLGMGGQAVVVAAVDRTLGVERALKILLPELAARPKHRARFASEARTLAALDHPNVVRVSDVRDAGRTAYAVMELVPGGSLAAHVERAGPLPPGLAVRVTLQLCAGLAAAHDAGVIHRDVKPHNVLVGRGGVVKLVDFGIARTSLGHRTEANAAMGTHGYSAPEQLHDARSVDARADVYGVGMTLFTLVTGAEPGAWLADRAHPRLPDPLRRVIERATSERPTLRYPTIRDLADALEASLAALPADDEVLPCEPPEPPPDDGERPSIEQIVSWLSEDEPAPRASAPEAARPPAYSMPDPLGAPGEDPDRPSYVVDEPPRPVLPRRFADPVEPPPPPRVVPRPRRKVPMGLVFSALVAVLGLLALVALPLVEPTRRLHQERVETEARLRTELEGQRETVALLASLGADAEHLGSLLDRYEQARSDDERGRAAVDAFVALDAEARRRLVERSPAVDRANASLGTLDFALQAYLEAREGPAVPLPGW